MHPEWLACLTNVLPPLQPLELDELEQVIGVNLPASLRELFAVAGGGDFRTNVFETPPGDELGIRSLLSLRASKGLRQTEFVKTYRRIVGRVLPAYLVPFATAAGGDYYSVRSSDGAVVVWLHDTYFDNEREQFVSSSLAELFELVRPKHLSGS